MAYENFDTDYTIVGAHITKTATRTTVTEINRGEVSYCYCDKEADHFSGNFEHLIDVRITGQSITDWAGYNAWALWNALGELEGLKVGDHPGLMLYSMEADGIYYFGSREAYNGSIYDDWWSSVSLNTTYYCTVKRVDSAFTINVYSDSDRTDLLDTLSLSLHSTPSFRYIYSAQSDDVAISSMWLSGYCENLDLQEVGEIYDETGRLQVILAAGDESEIATRVETAKAQTILVVAGRSDLAMFNELDRLQTILAVTGGTVGRPYKETLEQVILATMGESEAVTLNELERLQVVLAALGSEAKASFNEVGLAQTILAAMGGDAYRLYDEIGRLQDILVPIGAVDALTFNELGRLQIVLAALGHLSLATFTELGKEQIILAILEGYAVKRRELAAIRNLSAVRNLDALRVLPRQR